MIDAIAIAPLGRHGLGGRDGLSQDRGAEAGTERQGAWCAQCVLQEWPGERGVEHGRPGIVRSVHPIQQVLHLCRLHGPCSGMDYNTLTDHAFRRRPASKLEALGLDHDQAGPGLPDRDPFERGRRLAFDLGYGVDRLCRGVEIGHRRPLIVLLAGPIGCPDAVLKRLRHHAPMAGTHEESRWHFLRTAAGVAGVGHGARLSAGGPAWRRLRGRRRSRCGPLPL